MRTIFIFSLIISWSYAQDVKILEISNPVGSCNGCIKMHAMGSLAPFEISLVRHDGWSTLKSSVNGEYTFSGLCGGLYKIYVQGTKSCPYEFEQLLKNCESLIVTGDVIAECYTAGINHGFESSKGRINISVQGGQLPLSFEWRDYTGKVVSNSQNLTDQPPGDYKLFTKDNHGCLDFKSYHLYREYVTIKVWKNTAISLNSNKLQIEMTPYRKNFDYKWSDGLSVQSTNFVERKIDKSIPKYTVTITELQSKCQVIASETPIPNNFKFNLIETKNPSPNNMNDGFISILFKGQYSENIEGILKISRNGILFRTEAFNPIKHGYRPYKIHNLPIGQYKIEFYDQEESLITSISASI